MTLAPVTSNNVSGDRKTRIKVLEIPTSSFDDKHSFLLVPDRSLELALECGQVPGFPCDAQ